MVSTPAAADAVVLEEELRRRVASLDLEQKVALLGGADFWVLNPEPGVGLRTVVTSDGPAGVRGVTWDERSPSVNVPSPTALAASWDPAAVTEVGRLLAAECRRKGVDVLLAPTVNLHRTPYGGRHFECLSEDPLLTAIIGRAFVTGVQSEGVAACVKHVVANDSETQRFTLQAHVAERTLRELYLLPFEAICAGPDDAGRAWSAMAAYNGVNGHTMTESPVLREVLKDEWGFDGPVFSDWGAVRSTAPAARAGTDVAMPGPRGHWGDALVRAVRAGEVPQAALDDKVLRVLRLAARVGALDGVPAVRPGGAEPWSDAAVARRLRESAVAGTVLLRNAPAGADPAPLLPLDGAALRSVAVIGPNAARLRTLGGGSATVFPPYVVSVPEGLRAALGDRVDVRVLPGVTASTRLPVANPAWLRVPDDTLPDTTGSAGAVLVRCLDADGAELGREVRRSASFNWFDRIGEVPLDRVAAVEVATVLRADASGEYRIGTGGLGRFELLVGGEPAFDVTLALPAGVDVVEGLSRPPQRDVAVELAAGQEVGVVLRHHLPDRSGVPDPATDNWTLSLQLAVQPPTAPDDDLIAGAVEAASAVDVAVVVVGTTEEVESEGYDRDDLTLPGRQDDLVRAVVAANPRTVVVVNAGAPVLLPWADRVPAVLMAWFPGQEGGNAIADVLLGSREPTGRLPVSWPTTEQGLPSSRPVDGVLSYDEGLYIGYRGYDRDGGERQPAFAFGHGLGYTSWSYDGIDVTGPDDDGVLDVVARVTNTGSRPGREVVQLYLSRPDGAVDRPVRTLAGYAIVEAAPGESVDARVRVGGDRLRHWDETAHAWAIESGPVEFHAGRSARDLPVRVETRVP